MVASHWVLQIERRYAKFGKDLLKKFGWLDLGRKVYSQKDGLHICFPVTDKFCASFYDHQHYSQDAVEELNDFQLFKPFRQEGVLLNGISESKALNLLMACGATKLADELVKERKAPKSPLKIMSEAVASLLSQHGLPPQLLEQLPTRSLFVTSLFCIYFMLICALSANLHTCHHMCGTPVKAIFNHT